MGDGKLLSIFSIFIGLVGIIFSASLFSADRLSFETMFWIMIGIVFFIIIMLYGDMRSDLKSIKIEQKNLCKDFKLEQKKSDDKFKIYDRLARIERMVNNGS